VVVVVDVVVDVAVPTSLCTWQPASSLIESIREMDFVRAAIAEK
jgi:hypothetical protein